MSRNIIDLVHEAERQKEMVRSKLVEPVKEAAQIVIYFTGTETPVIVRYTDMKKAQKEFAALIKAADSGKGISLSGPVATLVVRFAQNISHTYLVAVDESNSLMADTQKRMNAMMA